MRQTPLIIREALMCVDIQENIIILRILQEMVKVPPGPGIDVIAAWPRRSVICKLVV